MNRRHFLQALGLGAASVAVGRWPGASARAQVASGHPNIVVILVDDLGWADVGCYCAEYGNTWYETPNIDRLAAEGMKFTNGYAACAVCSPTRAATLTGRYPPRTGITDWIRGSEATVNPEGYEGGVDKEVLCPKNYVFLDPSEITIAEVLKPAGYTSGHVGKWHLGGSSFYPPAQGFDVNIAGSSWGHPFNGYFDPYGMPTLQDRNNGEYLTDRESEEALKFIQTAVDQKKPFFLYMAHYAVHTPVQAKSDLIAKYNNKPKPAGYEHLKAVYAAMIESVDQAVGAMVAKLDALGVCENTIIVFTSDNGGLKSQTDNRPLRLGKGYPYEGGIREPWIVKWPAVVKPGSVCHEPIISCDLMPTLCEITGRPLPEGRDIDGDSLLPLLRQTGSLGRRDLFWHFPHYRTTEEVPYSIVRSGRWKLIKRYAGESRLELYDLDADLSEKYNLATRMPRKVRELDEKLNLWLRRVNAKMPKPNPNYVDAGEENGVRLG